MSRLLVPLLFVVLTACGPEQPEQAPTPPAPAVDLEEARAVFAEGDVEASKALAGRIAAMTSAPVAWLLEGLTDENRHIREWSAHALGDLAPQQDDVVQALIRAFEDEDDWVRWKAARALGNIGPLAAPALPLLEKAASDVREEVVYASAQRAVKQIRGEDGADEGR